MTEKPLFSVESLLENRQTCATKNSDWSKSTFQWEKYINEEIEYIFHWEFSSANPLKWYNEIYFYKISLHCRSENNFAKNNTFHRRECKILGHGAEKKIRRTNFARKALHRPVQNECKITDYINLETSPSCSRQFVSFTLRVGRQPPNVFNALHCKVKPICSLHNTIQCIQYNTIQCQYNTRFHSECTPLSSEKYCICAHFSVFTVHCIVRWRQFVLLLQDSFSAVPALLHYKTKFYQDF